MQKESSRIWTLSVVFISHNDNRYTTYASIYTKDVNDIDKT